MNDVVAEALCKRHKDWHRNKENGRPFHEAPHQHEKTNDDEKHGRDGAEVGRDERNRLLRDAGIKQHKLEETGRRNHEHHLGGLFDGFPEDARQILHLERFGDEKAEQHHVERSNRSRFRCREEAGKHAANHDHGREKRKEGILKRLPADAVGGRRFLRIIFLVAHERRPGHKGKAQKEPRKSACFKERIDACLREPCVKNERNARRNNGAKCTARSNGCATERSAVSRLRHLRNGDHPDPGRTGGCGPRHGRHDDARCNGGIGKAAPAMPEANATKAEKAL